MIRCPACGRFNESSRADTAVSCLECGAELGPQMETAAGASRHPPPITYSCPQCGTSRDVPADMAGQRTRCQECNEIGRVPGEVVAAPPARKASAPPTSCPAENPAPARAGRARWPLVLAGAIALVGLTVGITVAVMSGWREKPAPNSSTEKLAPTDKESGPGKTRPEVAEVDERLKKAEEGQNKLATMLEEHAKLTSVIEEEQEKTRLFRVAFEKLTQGEKTTLLGVARKIKDATWEEDLLPAERAILYQMWTHLSRSDVIREGVLKLTNKHCGFATFCANVGIRDDSKQLELAAHYYFAPYVEDYPGWRTCLDVSERIRQTGFNGLGAVDRDYVLRNRALFATVLPK